MDLINVSLITGAFLNFVLAIFIYFKSRKNPINISYSLVIIAVIGWIWGMLMYRNAPQQSLVFWTKILYVMATFTSSTFLYFSTIFPDREAQPTNVKKLLIALPNLVIIVLTLWPNFIIKDAVLHLGRENEIIFGKGYFIYIIYILGLFGLGFLILLKKYTKSTGITRVQFKFVFAGYFLAANLAFITNLIMPWLGDFRLNWLGQILTLLMVGFTVYAITKHHLMNIKVIATELFTALLGLVLFINIFSYDNYLQLGVNIAMFTGGVIFGILLIRSVLREIEARGELREAYKELKKLDDAKSEFISIASHQLRTPLTAIKGYISMILDGSYGKLSSKIKEPMRNVYQSNKRLIDLVNNLLNVSRIETGKIDFERKKVSIKEVISSVIGELKIKADEKDIYLKYEEGEDLPEIRADYSKIRDVVINIVDNAIKYTQKGGVTISTQLKEDPKGDKIVVKVKDTGKGLSQEELSHLFKKFSRGTAGKRLNTKGAGLGLYVAHRYVEMHDGKIWAQSEGKGKGSTFFIELPVEKQR